MKQRGQTEHREPTEQQRDNGQEPTHEEEDRAERRKREKGNHPTGGPSFSRTPGRADAQPQKPNEDMRALKEAREHEARRQPLAQRGKQDADVVVAENAVSREKLHVAGHVDQTSTTSTGA